LDQVITALEALDPTPGRLQAVAIANGAILLLDDFKGAQETIEAALEVLAQIPANRHIVLLGDVSEPVGNTGPIYRHLGECVARVACQAGFVARVALALMGRQVRCEPTFCDVKVQL
jgi:UDP-N-acetylmuramyl pentapeptide synthase